MIQRSKRTQGSLFSGKVFFPLVLLPLLSSPSVGTGQPGVCVSPASGLYTSDDSFPCGLYDSSCMRPLPLKTCTWQGGQREIPQISDGKKQTIINQPVNQQ